MCLFQMHKVVMPKEYATRQSLGFFGKPDDEELIVCVDGSKKYPAMTAIEFYKAGAEKMVK